MLQSFLFQDRTRRRGAYSRTVIDLTLSHESLLFTQKCIVVFCALSWSLPSTRSSATLLGMLRIVSNWSFYKSRLESS